MKKKLVSIVVFTLVIAAMVAPVTGIMTMKNIPHQSAGTDTRPLVDDHNLFQPGWTIVATYPIPEGASGLAWDDTYLYCGIYGANGDEVYQIDPDTGGYSLLFSGPQEDAYGLTYDGIYLWTTDHPGSSSTPAKAMQLAWNGSVIDEFNLPDHYMSGIAYDAGDFWVATYYPDPATIYQVDSKGVVLHSFTAPDNQPWDLCLENGNLWMADYWGDTLYKIDPVSGKLLESHASEGVDPAGVVYDGRFLWYCDNGAGGYDYLYKVDLQGGGTPEISVPVTSHDYGTVTLGDTITWDCTVQSVGTADLEISGVTFTGSDDLSCPISFPLTIPYGSSDDLPIVYEPDTIGPLDATATIESNDPVTPEVDLTLTGYSVAPGPDIYLPEDSHDYGTVRIHATTRWLMEIQNMGNETLTIESIVSDDSHFYVDAGVSFPLNISVLGSEEVGIWFSPATPISYSATVTITSNDPDENPYNVTLLGDGILSNYPIGTLLWDYLIDTDYDNSPKAIAAIPDVNGDGVDDVIICSEDDYIRCFNGNSHGTADVLWEHEIYAGSVYNQNGLAITEDVNDDGYNDVVVGSSWGGRLIRTLSGKTGEEIWTHDTHEYGDGGWVYQVDCSFDYNGDGVIDVLASTGDDASDTGPKRVYCLNGSNGVSIWECPLGGPGFSVIGIEDCTGDGIPDAVAGASNELETEGYVYGINGYTGNMIWPYTVIGTSVWALEQIDDITDDSIKDIIAGDFSFGDGNLYGLDATNGDLIYSTPNSDSIHFFDKLDDVNSDGHPDIVLGHNGASAKVASGQTGSFVWSHPVADKSWCVARIADISGDEVNDVVVGTLYTNNYCYFLNGVNGSELDSIPFGTPVDAIGAIPDIVGDGSWEMVAGGRNGYVACYSGGLALNNPPAKPRVFGPTSGETGVAYNYSGQTLELDGDQLFFQFDWGDGNLSSWLGPVESGEYCNTSHTWTTMGTYNVRVQAKDEHDTLSEWSDNLTMTIGFYLDLTQFPMYLAENGGMRDVYQMTGAATAQMLLNYLSWNRSTDPSPPLTYDNQTWIYEHAHENNPNTSLGYIDAGGMLGVFYGEIVDQDYGYHFIISHNDTQNGIAQRICGWIAFNVSTWCDLQEGHPAHVAALIPAYGEYTQWMAIRGILTNKNPDPYPSGPPGDVEVYGFWVNDPLPAGIGENTYKSISEFFATYYLPLSVDDDPYDGEFVAVTEPPEDIDEDTLFAAGELTLTPSPVQFSKQEARVVKRTASIGNMAETTIANAAVKSVEHLRTLDNTVDIYLDEAELVKTIIVNGKRPYTITVYQNAAGTTAIINGLRKGEFRELSIAPEPASVYLSNLGIENTHGIAFARYIDGSLFYPNEISGE